VCDAISICLNPKTSAGSAVGRGMVKVNHFLNDMIESIDDLKVIRTESKIKAEYYSRLISFSFSSK
jgi:hypothetical protein